MNRVRLFRHGQSESNAGGKTDWPANVHLTDMGKSQAVLVAERTAPDCSMVVISEYVRTAETAGPLLERIQVPMQVWPVHEFTYLDVDVCSQTTHVDRAPLRKRYWDKMDPDYVDGRGAESFNQLRTRALEFTERLREAPALEGWLDVFTHADFIRAVLFNIMVPDGTMIGFQTFCQAVAVPNAACIRLMLDEHGVYFSRPDVSHLPKHLITGADTGPGSPA